MSSDNFKDLCYLVDRLRWLLGTASIGNLCQIGGYNTRPWAQRGPSTLHKSFLAFEWSNLVLGFVESPAIVFGNFLELSWAFCLILLVRKHRSSMGQKFSVCIALPVQSCCAILQCWLGQRVRHFVRQSHSTKLRNEWSSQRDGWRLPFEGLWSPKYLRRCTVPAQWFARWAWWCQRESHFPCHTSIAKAVRKQCPVVPAHLKRDKWEKNWRSRLFPLSTNTKKNLASFQLSAIRWTNNFLIKTFLRKHIRSERSYESEKESSLSSRDSTDAQSREISGKNHSATLFRFLHVPRFWQSTIGGTKVLCRIFLAALCVTWEKFCRMTRSRWRQVF